MISNGVIEIKTLEMTNDSILINFWAFFGIRSLENIHKLPNKILGKISLVPVRLTFLYLKKMEPPNNRGGAPPTTPPNYPPPDV